MPAVHKLINALVEYLDGQPFSTDDQARRLRSQAAAVAELLPAPPPADLLPLAVACRIAAGVCTRFMDRAAEFDAKALHWPEYVVDDLCGVEYLLDEIADHLPPVPAGLRSKRTLTDEPANPDVQLAYVVVVLRHVENLALDACETLPFNGPLYGRLDNLAWAIRGRAARPCGVRPSTTT